MWEILIILGLILANGFFAAAEIAILTARRSRLDAQAKSGDRSARIALWLAENPAYFLPTVQVGITLVGTLASAFGGARLVGYLAEWLDDWPVPFLVEHRHSVALGVVVLAITFFSLVLGELVPKRLALNGAERLARFVAIPMRTLAVAARPAVWFMGFVTEGVVRLLGSRSTEGNSVSVEDIEHLIRTGTREGVLEPAEQRAASKALRLGDRRVHEIMRPRIEVEALDIDTPTDEIIGAVAMAGFSRLPVYEKDLDHVIGFVYIKDLWRQQHLGWAMELRKLLRPALFVPGLARIDKLMELFRQRRTQMAIVLDEYGGTDGLVTLEDVLEELVGEIRDEHALDQEQEIVERGNGTWLVDGAVSIVDLLDHLGLEELRSQAPREVSSVAGLIQEQLERIGRIGDHVDWHRLSLEVVDMDGPRIDRVLVVVTPDTPSSTQGESGPDHHVG